MRWVLLIVFVVVVSLALFAFLVSTMVSTDAEKFNAPAKDNPPPDPTKMERDMQDMRTLSKKLKIDAEKKKTQKAQ